MLLLVLVGWLGWGGQHPRQGVCETAGYAPLKNCVQASAGPSVEQTRGVLGTVQFTLPGLQKQRVAILTATRLLYTVSNKSGFLKAIL